MTNDRQQSSSLAVAWAGVGLAALVALGSMASAYYDNRTHVEVTGVVTTDDISKLTKQGENLTKSINDLNLQIAHMPTTSAIESLVARLDQHTGQIADLYNLTTGLRHDLDNRLPPPIYRNPPK